MFRELASDASLVGTLEYMSSLLKQAQVVQPTARSLLCFSTMSCRPCPSSSTVAPSAVSTINRGRQTRDFPPPAVSLRTKSEFGHVISRTEATLGFFLFYSQRKTARSLRCFSTMSCRPCPSASSVAPSTISTVVRGRYMRDLPAPAVSLRTELGQRLFDEARAAGTAQGALNLMSTLQTQMELTFCGLAALSSILNALQIDPQSIWKGSWRWYDESMLVDAGQMEQIRVDGVTFQQLIDIVPKDKVKVEAFHGISTSLEDFRDQVTKATSSTTSFVLANYFRPALGQTGDGHYSPIGAYNAAADSVLILDVARFKYPPHWLPSDIFLKAMASRGFMVISKS